MIEFYYREKEFLNELEEARIATSHDDIPHVKPVSFVFVDNSIVVATDYNTRTYNNIKANSNAGIVIDVYKYGAPIHAGFGLGFDRLVAIMIGIYDIREVIAFPKTKDAQDLMMDAPSEVDKKQLDELGLSLKRKKK